MLPAVAGHDSREYVAGTSPTKLHAPKIISMAINTFNLAHWNEVTPHHVASSFYRTEDFRRGEIVVDPVVREAVGEVAGKRLLHLQCHFGLDTLSLARMGAQVTGLDFSPPAIVQ